MAKPVEIEFLMKDGLTPGLKDAENGISSLSKKAKIATANLKAGIKEQTVRVKEATQRVRELEKAYAKAGSSASMSKAKTELEAAKKLLREEQEDLQELKGRLQALTKATAQFGTSMRSRLREITEEIAALTLEYRNMSEEERNAASGQQLKAHIDKLTEDAGELRDAMMDTRDAIDNAASDTRGFDQMAGAMQLVVDGFGLATGAAQLFGASEEDLVEAQTKLQSVLVISNALTSMQTQLQAQSAVMQGVNIIQTKAAATAEAIKTAAQGKGIIVTKLATIAQAAFNAVAKANPYVLLAASVVTVVGALFAFSKGSAAAKRAEEERQAQLEESKRKQEEYRKVIVDTAGDQVASFLKMKKEWEALGNSFDKKKKFITDTKDEWAKLGKEIRTVNEMEEMFRNGTQGMINAIIYRAELKAYETKIQEVADNMVNEVEKNKTFTYTKVKAGALTGSGQGFGIDGHATFQDLTDDERKAVAPYIKQWRSGASAGDEITEEGARIINAMRKKAENSAALQRQQDAKDNAANKISGYVNDMKVIQDKLDKEMSGLTGFTVTDEKDKPTTDNTTGDDRLREEQRMAEELLALRRKNEQDNIDIMADGKEKRLLQVKQEYKERMDEIARQEAEWKEAQGGTLTEDQTGALEEAKRLAEQKRDGGVAEIEREELEKQATSMREYLKEYGNFQQQKLAITEEYEEKIGKATTEGEKLRLTAERDSELRGVEHQAMSQQIDWQVVFGNLTGMVGEQIEGTLKHLEKYTKKEEFAGLSETDKKTVYEAIEKLREAVPGGKGTLDFGKIQQQMEALGASVNSYQQATLEQERAYKRLENAQKAYRTAKATGTAAEIEAAEIELDAAKKSARDSDEAYNKAYTNMRNLGEEYSRASADTIDGLNQVSDGLRGFASGSLQGVFQGLQNTVSGLSKLNIGGEVGKAIGSLSKTLSSAGFVGQLISAILGILDILKDGIGTLISSLIDTILGAVSGILDNILSGDIFVQVGQSLLDGITGIFDALTWGGFSSWFDTSNAKEVQATIDRLTYRNELLQTAIEDLTDTIGSSQGTKSVSAYRDAYKYQQEVNANYLGMAQAQAGYHGSHHSWNYYWGGFSQAQIDKLSGQIGRQWNGDIWNLTPEEMKMLRSNPDMWAAIQNTGKGNYGGRLTEKLDAYIDQAGKLEELTTQLYEGLTGISFDDMYGSFIDTLMDMDATSEDFANNISEYFMRAMLSNKIGELYADKLEEWWKKFGKAMEDNDLTEAERNALQNEYMGYVDEAMKLRDELAAATGYDEIAGGTSQSGKSGGFAAMTQDQGTKLEGMFTSGLQHWSSMDARMEDVSSKMNIAESHLARIAENTGVSAGCLGEIKDDIKRMIRDGVKAL